MKKGIFLLLMAAGFNADAQSLKDLLYSGKLKNDPSSVVRKTDDLSTKIDTSTRKPVVEAEKPKAPVSATAKATVETTAPKAPEAVAGNPPATLPAPAETAAAQPEEPAAAPVAPVKSNSRIWKEFADSLVKAMKPDVQASRKVKKESYYITIEYEIDTTGQVTVLNITSAPGNDFLRQQVKDRLASASPLLAPVVENGKARKVKRGQNIMITKE